MEGHLIETLVYSTCIVETKLNLCLKIRMNKVASTDHKERTDWRMMRDLLSIDRTSIYKSLKGLTKNRVKRFCHFDIKKDIADRECYDCLHSLETRCCNLVLKKQRSISYSLAETL